MERSPFHAEEVARSACIAVNRSFPCDIPAFVQPQMLHAVTSLVKQRVVQTEQDAEQAVHRLLLAVEAAKEKGNFAQAIAIVIADISGMNSGGAVHEG